MHVLRSIDRSTFAIDFLVHTDTEGAYDEEIARLGARLISLPHPTRRLMYARRFREAIRPFGPYDIVHSHVHHFSGVVLRAASLCRIGIRISHSHSDTSATQAKATTIRRVYLSLTKALIRRYGTMRLAASTNAGRALFGCDQRDARCPWDVLHYGIDLNLFSKQADRTAVRQEFGLHRDTLVVGHVGNFYPVKNHDLLISTFAEINRRHPNSALLLVGDGPLRPHIEERVAALGLTDRVIFAGPRSDVPRLLTGAVDIFMFPSLFEGLPIAVIEAQAAGLPILLSDRVSAEVDILPNAIHRLTLESGPAHWATACLKLQHRIEPSVALRHLAASDMNIERSVNALRRMYELAIRNAAQTVS
jgi:glycosyltransferase involved in cell wall biosynthesis